MRQQVVSTFYKQGIRNHSILLVNEYNARHRLAKIGLTSDLSKLPGWKADAFLEISAEYDRLEEEKRKRTKGK